MKTNVSYKNAIKAVKSFFNLPANTEVTIEPEKQKMPKGWKCGKAGCRFNRW